MVRSPSEHSVSIAQQIAARIRSERVRKGMLLRDIADATGITKSALSNYERGVRSPRAEQLVAIAAALGVAPADLLPPPPSPQGLSRGAAA